MDLFARCFLLIFAQLYVGGMLTLAIPPFHEIERGFYKSTGGVYLGFGVAALLGRFTLAVEHGGHGALEIVELCFWFASVAAGAVYLWSLWGEAFVLRARAFSLCWMMGSLALIAGSQFYRLGGPVSIESLIYPINFLVSALLLGAVSTGMLLGHWYLIDHNLKIDPFRHLLSFYIGTLVAQVVIWVGSLLVLAMIGSAATATAGQTLYADHSALLLFRLALSPLSAAAMAWMIWRVLQIPQTMAATGLFYVAILAVFVGEMMGRFILFRTNLPL